MNNIIERELRKLSRAGALSSVVPYEHGREKPVLLDLSVTNERLTKRQVTPDNGLQEFVDAEVSAQEGSFGYGGYLEQRALYGTSGHFDGAAEPRVFHLGIDIWMPPGTPLFAPLEGTVHSFQENRAMLDYGPTILLKHQLGGCVLHTLFGHLSRESLHGLTEGKKVAAGSRFAALGSQTVNGGWPPHLHFQLILDLGEWRGDYPGVGERSKLDFYRANCPDPALLLPWANGITA